MTSRRAMLLLLSLLATFAALRVYLHFSPNTDLNVGHYNVHHLFTGLLLLTGAGIPLVIGVESQRRGDFATVVFGIGLALALDEWVYLIATDGSNASYWLPVSFWGAVVMVGLAVAYIVISTLRRG